MEKEILNPGSEEAIAQGCTCPVIDNHYGKGIIMKEGEAPAFWRTGSCPIHGFEELK